MKKLLYTLILSVAASCTHRTAVEADYNVVPLPCSMLPSSGGDFRLTPSTCLVIADSTQFVNLSKSMQDSIIARNAHETF